MSTPTTPVQAIAITPGTHLETIAAVAIASAVSASTPRPEHVGEWAAWFDGAFTKTVRRATRSAQIAKLEADLLVQAEHQTGSAKAYAYAPMTYDRFPKHLRQLQVSGLDVDRDTDRTPDYFATESALQTPHAPLVVISRDVSMSTGKTAAQVAHALVAWTQFLPEHELERWSQHPALRLQYGGLDEIAADQSITIQDNGLTEIAPGTATVRIALP